MRTKQLFLTLALLCAVVQGAWAQANWDEVYAMTNTTAADWIQLNAGSTTGRRLGTVGLTRYYYADANCTFININAGGSGLTIQGTVYLYVPEGVIVTCAGANASGTTGAGAGIELASGNVLYFLGKGTVNAMGGNAADGGNGTDGSDAGWNSNNYWSGTGGAGGHGGGGAGAGIGTRGGDGGNGGAGAAGVSSKWSYALGGDGTSGTAGTTAGDMGGLYKSPSFVRLTATGGAAASRGGSAGTAGKSILDDDTSYNYCAAGGGGGGGGGFGGAASGIGTGGPGGGGGGGGHSGSLEYAASGYYVVKGRGGKGGQNANGTRAATGGESILNYNAINNGQVKSNSSGWGNSDGWDNDQRLCSGGGAAGHASTSEQAYTVTLKKPEQSEWNKIYVQTKTRQSDWTALPLAAGAEAKIGTPGSTTYYFAQGDLAFGHSWGGHSGLTIQGTVYLFIPSGSQITCKGANARGSIGAGAGIELASGNTLYLLGSGTVNAIGGNAADGGNGADGDDSGWDHKKYWSGAGGKGGDGGGGAGAGIGTRGGDGGNGGAGGGSQTNDYRGYKSGLGGSNGNAGATAGGMGTLYVVQPLITVNATGGAAASTGGRGGKEGRGIIFDATSRNYYTPGGGGGGGGGFGGAATDIGAGGPGGGGGGGGASGNLDGAPTNYDVFQSPGGHGGQNADETWAAVGGVSFLSRLYIEDGKVITNSSGWTSAELTPSIPSYGNGGNLGSAPTSGFAHTVEVEWPTQGGGTESAPFLISSKYDWNNFAECVNDGSNFSGMYVKLSEDISVSTKVGTVTGSTQMNAFSGTFDGDGHTITATITDTGNQGTALFSYINGATIKNLKVAGTITGGMHAAAIVGFAKGTGRSATEETLGSSKNVIENCVATASVSGGTHIGGILGHGLDSDIAISGCVFSGTMTGGATAKGALFGWGDNGGTKSVTNCLYLMADGQNTDGLDLVRMDAGTVSVTNCCKTTSVGSYGKQCLSVTTAPANLGEQVQAYDVLTAYQNGILYDGTYYVVSATISLADNADNSTTINTANGQTADVTLQGRTFYRDGTWNTLCLPFSVDNFTGTPLEGATVKTLASTAFSGGTLTMDFTEDVSSIEAGKPYIVKWENTPVDLSTLTADYTAQNNETLTGMLGGNYKISIAAGATVKLQDVTINGNNVSDAYEWAGISCLGNATIILGGTNTVGGFNDVCPGIYVPVGSTLTIKGSGSLTASTGVSLTSSQKGYAAGIGGGYLIDCGNIVIEGGAVNAYGGSNAAAIGGGRDADCGTITITDGVTRVTANKGKNGTNSIGAGSNALCGTITIGGEVRGNIFDSYTYEGTGSGRVDVVVNLPNIENPVFNNVIINDAAANVETDYVDFVGTYSPVSIYTAENTNLYVGNGNTLYYPTETGLQVNACRAYFQLKQGLTAGEPTSPQQARVRAFVLNSGDDETTGILTTNFTNSTNSDTEWYSLDGRRLDGKPTRRGIYVNNGRKVVIK